MSLVLETLTKAKITDVVVLSQKNREPDQNPGAALTFSLELSNNALSYFDGSLKSFLYTKSAASSAGQQLAARLNIGRTIVSRVRCGRLTSVLQ